MVFGGNQGKFGSGPQTFQKKPKKHGKQKPIVASTVPGKAPMAPIVTGDMGRLSNRNPPSHIFKKHPVSGESM